MYKRKRDFNDDDDYLCVPGKEQEVEKGHYDLDTRVKKHTLDSDEEDDTTGNEKKYDILSQDDIEGQEEKTAEFDGDIQITPFNMNEEMEEGHFDKDGFYHWNKDDDVRDVWLDNIDWVKVKVNENDQDKKEDEDDESDDSKEMSSDDLIGKYKEMLDLMKPGENVARALRRLGGNKIQTASQRWNKKKKSDSGSSDSNTCNSKDLLKLTGLADKILTDLGNMNIYQETYESISSKIGKLSGARDLDMFSEKETDFSKKDSKESTDVTWEYKVDKDCAPRGPFSTSQMMSMLNDGTLPESASVRKTNDEEQWYKVSRIDFDLYL